MHAFPYIEFSLIKMMTSDILPASSNADDFSDRISPAGVPVRVFLCTSTCSSVYRWNTTRHPNPVPARTGSNPTTGSHLKLSHVWNTSRPLHHTLLFKSGPSICEVLKRALTPHRHHDRRRHQPQPQPQPLLLLLYWCRLTVLEEWCHISVCQ